MLTLKRETSWRVESEAFTRRAVRTGSTLEGGFMIDRRIRAFLFVVVVTAFCVSAEYAVAVPFGRHYSSQQHASYSGNGRSNIYGMRNKSRSFNSGQIYSNLGQRLRHNYFGSPLVTPRNKLNSTYSSPVPTPSWGYWDYDLDKDRIAQE